MAKLLKEHTYGTYIYMKIEIDGKIEEIGVFLRDNSETYRTSGDNDPERREQIIEAFNKLY